MPGIGDFLGLGSTSVSRVKQTVEQAAERSGEGESSFANVLTDALERADTMDKVNNVDSISMLAGSADNLSDILITAQKTELSVELAVQLRNKAMDAYKEIMNMQV